MPPAPCRLLLVDDDDDIAEVFTETLQADARVEVVGRARDGVEAIELAAELRPDVIAMDVMMPRLDGLEATRRIRAAQPDVHVLVVSGSMFDDRADEARTAGASGYLPKAKAAVGLADAALDVLEGKQLFRSTAAA